MDDLIVGKRLPLFIVETLKANKVEHLHELTNRTALSSAIEVELNPIQISKFRRLIWEDSIRTSQAVSERDRILVQREKSATRSELYFQLELETSTLEYINALLLDDDARLSPGAKRKLEQSKSMHQTRAKRLKTFLAYPVHAPISAIAPSDQGLLEVVSPRKAKRGTISMKVSWRFPEIEGTLC